MQPTSVHDPLVTFREWHAAAQHAAPAGAPRTDAMCLSTVDAAGLPQARFVDLKAVRPDGFVFCTSHLSPKGRQIAAADTVALTFWWEHVGRQVRVLGRARRLPDADSDALFTERSADARLATWAFDQSAPLADGERAVDRFEATRARFDGRPIPRPPHWGGYLVQPGRVEFLRFAENRAHHRVLYTQTDGVWRRRELQP